MYPGPHRADPVCGHVVAHGRPRHGEARPRVREAVPDLRVARRRHFARGQFRAEQGEAARVDLGAGAQRLTERGDARVVRDLGLLLPVDGKGQDAKTPQRRPARARRPRELLQAVPRHVVEVRFAVKPVARLGVGPREVVEVAEFRRAAVAQICDFYAFARSAVAHAHGHVRLVVATVAFRPGGVASREQSEEDFESCCDIETGAAAHLRASFGAHRRDALCIRHVRVSGA